MMSIRRIFVLVIFWMAVAAPQAYAQAQVIPLRMSHFLGPTSFFQVDLVEPWARELERRAGGKVKVEVINSSSPLGNVRNQASQVEAGTVDIALGLRGAEGDRFRRSSIIELPFLVNDADRGSRVLWALYKSGVIAEEYRNFKVLALFVQNPGLVHTRDARVMTLQDLKGLRLRVPNATVQKALESVGAVPMVLQPDEIMEALRTKRIDGIVTNWGTPIPGFNDLMKRHTAVPFYSSAFFIVMNKQRYEGLPPDVRAAVDAMSGDSLVGRFGGLWDKWDRPFREGALAPDHEVVTPDAVAIQGWRDGLQPVTDAYLASLEASGFSDARKIYSRLRLQMEKP